jgi:hypothetical protein
MRRTGRHRPETRVSRTSRRRRRRAEEASLRRRSPPLASRGCPPRPLRRTGRRTCQPRCQNGYANDRHDRHHRHAHCFSRGWGVTVDRHHRHADRHRPSQARAQNCGFVTVVTVVTVVSPTHSSLRGRPVRSRGSFLTSRPARRNDGASLVRAPDRGSWATLCASSPSHQREDQGHPEDPSPNRSIPSSSPCAL